MLNTCFHLPFFFGLLLVNVVQSSPFAPTLSQPLSIPGLHAHECLTQRNPHLPPLKPISYPSCISAARLIAHGSKAGAPMHFSRDPSTGMVLPEWWAAGDCVIRIDVKRAGDEDTFDLYTVANAASLIAQKCSGLWGRGEGLGGLGLIGPRKVVMIVVYGRTPPPPPPPPPRPRPRPSIGVS